MAPSNDQPGHCRSKGVLDRRQTLSLEMHAQPSPQMLGRSAVPSGQPEPAALTMAVRQFVRLIARESIKEETSPDRLSEGENDGSET